MKSTRLYGAMACAMAMLAACNPHKYKADDVSVQQVMSHEWLSFHVDKYWVEHGEKQKCGIAYDVVIHNIDSTTQEVANLWSDGLSVMITPGWAKYVNAVDCDMAYYRNRPEGGIEGQMYDAMLCYALQYGVDFFPMYYPAYSDWVMVSLPEKPSRYKPMADGSLRVKATVTQKHCYADHCELRDDPLTLYYDHEQGMFVAGENIEHGNGYRYEISGVSFDSRQALLDSLFDLDAPRYARYDRFEGDTLLQSIVVTRNTGMNDTVLDYPIVNVRSGDTTTLRQLQGTTLVHTAWFDVGADHFIAPDAYAPQVQNTVMLFTHSSNADLMRRACDSLGLPDNVYYAKGIARWLDLSYHNAILIGSDHQTVAACPAGEDFGTWMSETLKTLQH